MPRVPLNPSGWVQLCQDYPDEAVAEAVVGIARFGARIGFQGTRNGQRIAQNLLSAGQLPGLLQEDLLEQMGERLAHNLRVPRRPPPCVLFLPLGACRQARGIKRQIHHLSYPPGKSVNDGIPAEFGEITYSTVDEIIAIIQDLGEGAVMLKQDFQDAFRQIPVSPLNTPLLGFCFEERFYTGQFLPFGLHAAPYLFNLFAVVFHWILERHLEKVCKTVVRGDVGRYAYQVYKLRQP